jgi:hypothetical protein
LTKILINKINNIEYWFLDDNKDDIGNIRGLIVEGDCKIDNDLNLSE